MIDVSDGLALDLHRLADASGSGSRSTRSRWRGGNLDEALGGGEDYELVVAVGKDLVDALTSAFEAERLRPPQRIGWLVGDSGVRLLGGRRLERLGWQHRLG